MARRCASCCDPVPDDNLHRYCPGCLKHPPDVRYPNCTVTLVGHDGNGFAIMGRVKRALVAHMRDDLQFGAKTIEAEITAYLDASTEADYDHLLRTAMSWVEVE